MNDAEQSPRRNHPRDTLGRVLPEPWWPADRAAPGALELLRRFCNSINRENGADRFADPAGFDRWLVAEGRAATAPDRSGILLVAAVRDVFHDLTVANRDGVAHAAAWRQLSRLAEGITFGVEARPDGLSLYADGPTATHQFIGDLLLICLDAKRSGTWPRLKSCVNCHWTIFDHSKNVSARWCSMSACGGRHNARAYRRRKAIRP
ncbi:MAG: CGNR zinc finger domain-containing protein [Acidimicrobiales bacterium]